ncbi:MAG TPA: RDD family protein [Acidimicrobiales bacterium]
MTPGPADLAGVVSRGVAFAVDAVVALVVATLGYQVALAVLGVVGLASTSGTSAATALGYLLSLPVVFAVYCAGFWALLGRTPGMMVLGLRVVAGDGGPPGAGRSAVRALGYWVSAIGLVGFLWVAVDRQRQGFHDKLAGTYVVYDRAGDDGLA